MAAKFLAYALLALLSLRVALSASPSEEESSPSPSPELPPADSPLLSAPSSAPSPDTGSPLFAPTNSPMFSPPAPPPSDLLSPGSSPSPFPSPAHSPLNSGAPAPAPMEPSDINHIDNVEAVGEESKGDSGMSGGKKAGIAIGVILIGGVFTVSGFVYKKRQENIRRSHYGYSARGELL